MAALDPNIIIPAVTGIVGAFVGAISSFVPSLISEHFKNKKISELIEASLVSEIQALVEISETRKYMHGLEQASIYLKSQPFETEIPFTVNIPDHYSRIYQSNAHQIGAVNRSKAVDIVRFYQLADAVVQDIKPGGVLSQGGNLKAYEEAIDILGQALEIGRKISGRR